MNPCSFQDRKANSSPSPGRWAQRSWEPGAQGCTTLQLQAVPWVSAGHGGGRAGMSTRECSISRAVSLPHPTCTSLDILKEQRDPGSASARADRLFPLNSQINRGLEGFPSADTCSKGRIVTCPPSLGASWAVRQGTTAGVFLSDTAQPCACLCSPLSSAVGVVCLGLPPPSPSRREPAASAQNHQSQPRNRAKELSLPRGLSCSHGCHCHPPSSRLCSAAGKATAIFWGGHQ